MDGEKKHQNPILFYYGYRPKIDVVETANYTAEGAWAHTIPSERKICMLPPELRDYRLPIIEHEIEHNVDPSANEALVHARAFSPYRPERKRFVLRYTRC